MARVLLCSADTIGSSMAGPGIRYWEFAKALSSEHRVTLAAPNVPDVTAETFELVVGHGSAATMAGDYDVVVSQVVTPTMSVLAAARGARLIQDAYDPVMLEVLEVLRPADPAVQRMWNRRLHADLRLAMRSADAFVCASEKQRDLWLGSLMASGRVTPDAYRGDESLRRLIGVVPFGLPDADAVRTGPGFRDRLGIRADDKVLLWGGGVWNWFDPLTLIRAMQLIRQQRDDVKLVFMGLERPNGTGTDMQMANRAVRLAEELGLDGTTVFFNYGWVPYGERQNHLLEADLGVSTHFDHLETRYSFRTRMLDYFWAGLPVISTVGDSMSDLITARGLGRAVPYESPEALAAAVVTLLDDPPEMERTRSRVREVAEEFRWSRTTRVLSEMIDDVLAAPRMPMGPHRVAAVATASVESVRRLRVEQGTAAPLQAALRMGSSWTAKRLRR